MLRKAIVLFVVLCVCLKGFSQSVGVQDLKKDLEQAKSNEDKIMAMNNLVRALASNEPQAAIAYGKKAVKLASATNNQKLLANAYHNLGAVQQLMSNYKVAAEYNYKALEIREAIGDSLGICTSYNNIGNINNYLDAYSKALTFYQKSLAIATRIKNKEAISRALNNIGYAYEIKKDIKKSLHYYEQALPIKEEIGDKEGITVSLINIGNLYLEAGNRTKAIAYLEKSMALAQETGNQLNAGYAYRGLAEAYEKEGNLNKATDYALLSLEVAQKHGSFFEIKNAADALNEIYQRAGNYAQAHQYLTLSSAYKDSLHNESSRHQIEELQVKYEAEKKENENIKLLARQELQEKELNNHRSVIYLIGTLLITFATLAFFLFRKKKQLRRLSRMLAHTNKEVTLSSQELSRKQEALLQQAAELQKQKEELIKANKIKNKLFSIVAHDLRSPLVSLSSMLQLLRRGNIPENKKDRFLDLLAAEQQNSLWLIDNLFVWARSQMGGTSVTPVQLSLQQLVQENMLLLTPQAVRKEIQLKNAVDPELVAFADREMIKLVLRNLISNAIKFCSAGDSITLSAIQQEGQLIVSVSDTGVGIPAAVQAKLFNSNFTTHGTANEKGSGLGLQLCNDFIQLNGGSIRVESEPGEGSIFLFTLPAEPIAQSVEQAAQLHLAYS